MRSPNYGRRRTGYSHFQPIMLIGRRVDEDGNYVLMFDGPGLRPFEMIGGDWFRSIFRTELLKIGAFKLPHHFREAK